MWKKFIKIGGVSNLVKLHLIADKTPKKIVFLASQMRSGDVKSAFKVV